MMHHEIYGINLCITIYILRTVDPEGWNRTVQADEQDFSRLRAQVQGEGTRLPAYGEHRRFPS